MCHKCKNYLNNCAPKVLIENKLKIEQTKRDISSKTNKKIKNNLVDSSF